MKKKILPVFLIVITILSIFSMIIIKSIKKENEYSSYVVIFEMDKNINYPKIINEEDRIMMEERRIMIIKELGKMVKVKNIQINNYLKDEPKIYIKTNKKTAKEIEKIKYVSNVFPVAEVKIAI